MKNGAPEHPKTHDLAEWIDQVTGGALRAAGVDPLAVATGLLERLFQWTARYATNGGIGKYSDARIAAAMGWTGDAAALVDALARIGWVDRVDGPMRLALHDWADHCEDFVHARLARAMERFADGRRPRLSKLDMSERTRAAEYYDAQDAECDNGSRGMKCNDAAGESGGIRRPTAADGGQRLPPAESGGLPGLGLGPIPGPMQCVDYAGMGESPRARVCAGARDERPPSPQIAPAAPGSNPSPPDCACGAVREPVRRVSVCDASAWPGHGSAARETPPIPPGAAPPPLREEEARGAAGAAARDLEFAGVSAGGIGFDGDAPREKSSIQWDCSARDWEKACMCADLVERATAGGEVVGAGLSRRAQGFAALAQAMESAGKESWSVIIPTVGALVNSRDPKAIKILCDLRKYQDGAYPATDQDGAPCRIEQAARLFAKRGGVTYRGSVSARKRGGGGFERPMVGDGLRKTQRV